MKNKKGQIQTTTQPQPVATKEVPKKSKLWLWILLAALGLITIAVIAYFLLTGTDGGLTIGGGSSIPSPPALPS